MINDYDKLVNTDNVYGFKDFSKLVAGKLYISRIMSEQINKNLIVILIAEYIESNDNDKI